MCLEWLIKRLVEQAHTVPASHRYKRHCQDERAMIPVAYTVVQPNAVMVKLQNTAPTDAAVVTSRRSMCVALFTKRCVTKGIVGMKDLLVVVLMIVGVAQFIK